MRYADALPAFSQELGRIENPKIVAIPKTIRSFEGLGFFRAMETSGYALVFTGVRPLGSKMDGPLMIIGLEREDLQRLIDESASPENVAEHISVVHSLNTVPYPKKALTFSSAEDAPSVHLVKEFSIQWKRHRVCRASEEPVQSALMQAEKMTQDTLSPLAHFSF